MSNNLHRYTTVEFFRFKAFRQFTLKLKKTNVLVEPNNSGKSTVLAAFRIIAAGLRKANARKPENVMGPSGPSNGYDIDFSKISIAEENIFFNYDVSDPAYVKFVLSNGNSLILYFPERGVCTLIPQARKEIIRNTLSFKRNFDCKIGFVPILGPVEHNEAAYEKEAAYNALYNYQAARNFRNIWFHFPENFELFRQLLTQTWPEMDINPPEINIVDRKKLIHMYCLENRITREIFWSGFGFQVWCQMLTHVIQNKDASIFLVDEPDIYLHAELQRQLLEILKSLGPDIIIATHSTEMITEADTGEIVLINKKNEEGHRIRELARIDQVFSVLGSTLNPTLTQLAKTRRVVFVEGKDFQIISRFARKLKADNIASERGFAVIQIEGFNPDRIRMLKMGIEKTLGTKVAAAALLDKDYRSTEECNEIIESCADFCDMMFIHKCKEIENFLLVVDALDRASLKRANDRALRTGNSIKYESDIGGILDGFCETNKSYVIGQFTDFRQKFFRKKDSAAHLSTITADAWTEVEALWATPETKIATIPGKEALQEINKFLTEKYSISLTPSMVVDAMYVSEIPQDMQSLIESLRTFVASH